MWSGVRGMVESVTREGDGCGEVGGDREIHGQLGEATGGCGGGGVKKGAWAVDCVSACDEAVKGYILFECSQDSPVRFCSACNVNIGGKIEGGGI